MKGFKWWIKAMLRPNIQCLGSFYGVDGDQNPKVSCSFEDTLNYLAIDYWKAKELKSLKNGYKGYNSYKYWSINVNDEFLVSVVLMDVGPIF